MKVSFDFDGTLTREEVQFYATLCIEAGHEVWVHTARIYSEGKEELPDWLHKPDHKDLWEVVDRVGIPREQVVFCNMADKAEFLEGFAWHLDDDRIELEQIDQAPIDCVGLNVKSPGWYKAASALLKGPPEDKIEEPITIKFRDWIGTPAHQSYARLSSDRSEDLFTAMGYALFEMNRINSDEIGDIND